MTRIKLAEIAKKLGKTGLEIASETGLNRNTIGALLRGEGADMRLSTIERICSTYKLALTDVIDLESSDDSDTEDTSPIHIAHPYKQEGNFVPFTVLFPFLTSHFKLAKDLVINLGNFVMFCKDDYGEMYWEEDKMNKVAESIYEHYKQKREVDALFDAFNVYAHELRELYRRLSEKEILAYDEQALAELFKSISHIYKGYWNNSIFIDAFDAGFDFKTIEEVKARYHMTNEEASALTTPLEMTFTSERLLALLGIVKKIAGTSIAQDKKELKHFIANSPDIKHYVREYDYFQSNYSRIYHITNDDIFEEIQKFLKDDLWKAEYNHLSGYTKQVQKDMEKVLRAHRLKENPLYFFQKFVAWREYRKQINLMGIHLLHYVLLATEQKTGIPYIDLKYLSHEEMPGVFHGLVSRESLRMRREVGCSFFIRNGTFHLIGGAEAVSIGDELKARVNGEAHNELILNGRIASQGYAKGIARIVLNEEDFGKFNDGEILVSGMTRPEFVPLMKRAAAIVTNEGGITCHAAIVSRELGKPCIIGTQRATKMIKDGDLVEVRANHGTVRILNRQEA